MRYTYRALAGCIVLLGVSVWLAHAFSPWWYLLTLSCLINSLRQAAYTIALTQQPPKGPYDWFGFGAQKLLYPIALPYARLEFRMGETFWAWRRRAAPDSLLAATAYASAETRSKRAAALGLSQRASEAAELRLEEPSDLKTLRKFDFQDRDQISRTWPYVSALYGLTIPFVVWIISLTYRIDRNDVTRRKLNCNPVPYYFNPENLRNDLSVDPGTLEMRVTTYSGWNPVLRDLQELYCGNIMRNRFDKAFEAVLAAHQVLGELREDSLAGLGSREEFVVNSAFWVSAALSLVPRYFVPEQQNIMRLYEALARAKAVDIDILSARHQVVLGAPRQTRKVWKQLAPSLSEWVAAAMSAPAQGNRKGLQSFRLRLRERAADLYLGLALSAGATSTQINEIGWNQIVDALPPGAVLLDFYRYSAIDVARIQSEGIASYAADRYFGFVLNSDGMKYADLGAAENIDETALKHLAELSKEHGVRRRGSAEVKSEASLQSAEQALSRNLIRPFADSIASATHLLISADSVLAQIPFVSLSLDDGVPLLERCPISYVESARQLAGGTQRATGAPELGAPVVIGSPAFDLGETGGFAWFDDLAGAEDELDRVAKVLGVPAIIGPSATESRFKQICRPQILHIATHGFYVPLSEGEGKATGTPPIDNRWEALQTLESPLLRSGLALAGINSWLNGSGGGEAEDGVLTAEDVLEMDLRGTELAVLSACETGVGAALKGQGVFGLRRVFAIAGARSVIVSLWKIPDESTVELVLGFYRYLAKGMNKAQALQRAQLDLRRSRPDPFEWAAFICLGDVDPIKLRRTRT